MVENHQFTVFHVDAVFFIFVVMTRSHGASNLMQVLVP